jgi:hypothetical protein
LRERDDQDLKRLFGHLRTEERGRIPDFRTLMARAREEAAQNGHGRFGGRRTLHGVPRRLAWGGSLLAAAAAAALLLLPPGTSDSEFVQVVQTFSTDPASGAWKSPTDALLDLPGRDILSTVPTIGSRPWLAGPGASPRRNEL